MNRLMQLYRTRIDRTRTSLVLALALVALLAAACAGDGDATESTPTPTAPAPTPTSEPDPTPPPGDAYLAEARATLEGLADLLLAAAEVLERADVESEEWRAEAREALAALRVHHEEAEGLSAPAGYEETHEALTAATGRIARAAELLEDGIESQDVDALEEAAEEILHAVSAIEEARLALIDAGGS